MEDEKKSVQQQTESSETTADKKGNAQPEQQSDTEPKKPAPKKTAATVTETAKLPSDAEEKPAKPQSTDDNLREENARLQEQIARLQAEAAVTRLAQSCGVEPKAVPYVSKLIDITGAVKDGKCDDDSIKEQLDKILADLPQLKVHIDADDKKRVTPIGVAKDTQAEAGASKTTLATKKWNRFNN